jgi:hypothetical protein
MRLMRQPRVFLVYGTCWEILSMDNGSNDYRIVWKVPKKVKPCLCVMPSRTSSRKSRRIRMLCCSGIPPRKLSCVCVLSQDSPRPSSKCQATPMWVSKLLAFKPCVCCSQCHVYGPSIVVYEVMVEDYFYITRWLFGVYDQREDGKRFSEFGTRYSVFGSIFVFIYIFIYT